MKYNNRVKHRTKTKEALQFFRLRASDFDVDIYVTGSNSRMMSSEISTYLTGRYISFRI